MLPVFFAADRNADDLGRLRRGAHWYLVHGQTIVYVEKGTWYLVVMTRCKYLTKKNLCGIYFDRPKICREYTTDDCEYDTNWIFEKVFETAEQIWEYAEAILPPRRKKRDERPPADRDDRAELRGDWPMTNDRSPMTDDRSSMTDDRYQIESSVISLGHRRWRSAILSKGFVP